MPVSTRVLGVVLAIGCSHADRLAPRVTVNLDAPPSTRWVDVVTKYNSTIHACLEQVSKESPTVSRILSVSEWLFRDEHDSGWLPNEHWSELESIARMTRLPVGKLTALAALYDLTAAKGMDSRACTSVVAQGAATPPVHGRNLDYPLAGAMLNLTVQVDWQRGGETLFTSASYLGTVGFNTVVRPRAWSLSHDERDQGPLLENLLDVFVRRRVLTFSQLREIATSAADFSAAMDALRSVKLDAPSYFIVAGSRHGEGALITRDRDQAADVLNLTSSRWSLCAEAGRLNSRPTASFSPSAEHSQGVSAHAPPSPHSPHSLCAPAVR